QSRNIPAWVGEAGDKPRADGVIIKRHDDGNRSSRFFGHPRIRRTGGNNDIHTKMNQRRGEPGEAIEFSVGVSILNEDVFPLHITKLAESLAKCVGAAR